MNEKPQQLSVTQALKQGADLWALSDSVQSAWSAKIDWHLGFQIKKQRLKILQKPSPKINSILKKYQIPSLKWSSSTSPLPLLIESSLYLPNLWTLEVPFSTNWLDTIYDIWCSLNQPSLRIFAPKEIKKEAIEKKWKSVSKNIKIQYIINDTGINI